MQGSRFDALARRLSARASRRAVVGGAGAGLAALALHQAAAQDATPVEPEAEATPVAFDDAELLFVQNAGATTLAPGDGDIHTLTMNDVGMQTLYFANRPARMAGTMPTGTFVAAFPVAFADDPPNAALIGHPTAGGDQEEAVIVELTNPKYDAANATLTYQVEIIAPDQDDAGAFESAPLASLDGPREYAEAHLFIDDVDITPQDECKQACAYLIPGPIDPMGLGRAAWLQCIYQCMSNAG